MGKNSKEALIDIFIPVGIVPKDPQKPSKYYLELPPLTSDCNAQTFNDNFNFKALADVLTTRSGTTFSLPIGLTHEEAEQVADLHAHDTFKIIVHVTVPLSSRSTRRMTESEIDPSRIGVSSTADYFYLSPNTVFSANAIIAAHLMDMNNCYKTLRIPYSERSTLLWPQECSVINRQHPRFLNDEVLTMQSTAPFATQAAQSGGSPLHKKPSKELPPNEHEKTPTSNVPHRPY